MDAKPPPQAKQSSLTLYLERWGAVNSRNGPQTMASKMVRSVGGREALLSKSFFSFLQAYGIGSGVHTNLRQPRWNPLEELARGLHILKRSCLNHHTSRPTYRKSLTYDHKWNCNFGC